MNIDTSSNSNIVLKTLFHDSSEDQLATVFDKKQKLRETKYDYLKEFPFYYM